MVSGSSGKIDSRTQQTFPHDAMAFSDVVHGGALMLEVEKNRLDLKFLGADGIIRDKFTMMKNVNKQQTHTLKEGESIKLSASFVGDYIWSNQAKTASIDVSPAVGKYTYTVKDKWNCVQDVFQVNVIK